MRKTKKRVVRKECLHVAQKRFEKIQRQFWSYEKSCNMKTWASIQHLWCQVLFDQHWACRVGHQKLIRYSTIRYYSIKLTIVWYQIVKYYLIHFWIWCPKGQFWWPKYQAHFLAIAKVKIYTNKQLYSLENTLQK